MPRIGKSMETEDRSEVAIKYEEVKRGKTAEGYEFLLGFTKGSGIR